MDETETPRFSVDQEAAERRVILLFPPDDSDTESMLSASAADDDHEEEEEGEDHYHSLPSSPMASPPREFDPLRLDLARGFLDSGVMETEMSTYYEFESEREADLVEWIEDVRGSDFSLEEGSEQGDEMDAVGWDHPDPIGGDTDGLQMPSFDVDYSLEEIASILDHEEGDSSLDWVDMAEFSAIREMNTDMRTPLFAEFYSPDSQYVLDSSDVFGDCFPPNPNQQPNSEPEPDWEAASTTSSSIPDLEELVRNMELEVLLAMHNIYEGDPEMEMFRNFLELDRSVRGGPATSRSVLESLPNITADESMVDLQCAVCKDFVLVGESIKRLPCSHDFHGSCILPWLGIRNTCPLCRFELPTDDQSYESWRARQENQV